MLVKRKHGFLHQMSLFLIYHRVQDRFLYQAVGKGDCTLVLSNGMVEDSRRLHDSEATEGLDEADIVELEVRQQVHILRKYD